MKISQTFLPFISLLCVSAVWGAENGGLATLPVREVTVFKDGHAFVLREGAANANAQGEIVLDDLPTPVVGTFWAYEVGGKLRGALASRQAVSRDRPALDLAELIKANIGADVTVVEANDKRFDAKILAVPQAKAEDGSQGETDEARSRRLQESSSRRGREIVWLQTKEGVLVRDLSSLNQVIFKTPPRAMLARPEFENLLHLQLEKAALGQKSQVGMVYLQKGLRWIPSYRLLLGQEGKASLKMQATLANELMDLQNTTANLVIGVPSFAFKDVIDPISLQNDFARLSPLFESNTRSAGAFSNAIMSQRASNSYALADENAPAGAGGAAVIGGEKNEDFFVFSLKDVSLKKGERMSFALADYAVPFQDIYAQTAPVAPPADLYRYLSSDQQRESSLLAAPSVMHRLRLSNAGIQSFTTAPMLIENNGRLLAQTLMTYTAPGGRSDIDLAPAVDVTVKRKESETKRTPSAMRWQNEDFERVDVAGRLLITSYRSEPITLELSQQFLGTVDSAGWKGAFRKPGVGDEGGGAGEVLPAWWNTNSNGWQSVNGLSAATWTIQVPAKGKIEVPYSYHYFWR